MKIIKKNGFALTEVLLAIAVILLIGILGYELYAKARMDSQIHALSENVINLYTNVENEYLSNHSAYLNISTSDIVKAGLGQNLQASDGTLRSFWGGEITVQANDGYTAPVIMLGAVPHDICSDVIMAQAKFFNYVGVYNYWNYYKDGSNQNLNYSNISYSCSSMTNVDIFVTESMSSGSGSGGGGGPTS